MELAVKVRLSTNQELAWSGPATTKVCALKAFVEEQASIAPSRQRWLFGGQMLTDAHTLAAAKVPQNGVVQVMVRPLD